MDSITPNVFVNNLPETLAWYSSLGFATIMTVPENSDAPVWALMMNGNVSLMFQTFESLGDELPAISRNPGGSLLLYIKLKNICAFFEEIQPKVKVLKGLETTFYGATEFSVMDNNGYVLTFAEDEEKAVEL